MDTGATHSIVNPGICDPKWKIESHSLTLRTLQNNITTNIMCRIPMFTELGNGNDTMTLIECRFHNDYDGIIGNDILRKYKAVIDYSNNQLIINHKSVPLLNHRKVKTVKFISSTESGLIHILEHRNFFGEIIAIEGIYNLQDFKVDVETTAKCPNVIHLTENSS